ncbi:unnamed protein product [Parascedosporium putredinis]|uniref:Tyrosinase copper-binding domain-containing protein n=1 Tax=Parascedosporium putredinis TaxID=1442378 RepID=A0A9P1MEH7_9PEZI|nr:unnamed protein product [Parascedosporium putredinis]CAI8002791.1 unnamed protein product [Parascedosporium putredinis]
MMEKPALTPPDVVPGVTNRYEDFVGAHVVQADDAHNTGAFYPYHRLLLHLYEQEIQNCGWPAGIPTGTGPSTTKPPTPSTAPRPRPRHRHRPQPHCVRRDFAPETFVQGTADELIGEGMDQPDFGSFASVTEGSFHSAGHWGIGGLYGDMSDKWTSPSDPLFYLHHANVDRAWWSWQSRDVDARSNDISGPLVPFDNENKVAGNLTLDHLMILGTSAETRVQVKVADLMSVGKGRLCYNYDKLY